MEAGFRNPDGIWNQYRYHVVAQDAHDKTTTYKCYTGNDLKKAVASCSYHRTQGYADVWIYDYQTGKQVTRGQVRSAA